MTQILTYEQIDLTEWSTLVRESRTGTWFQSPEAYGLFASMPELFRPFAIAVERVTNERALQGVCVGYMTKEKNALWQYFTKRAIILGGPALAEDVTDEEVTALMQAVRENLQAKAIYVETRNFNDFSRWRGAFEKVGFAYKPHLNFHVDCRDKEKMWERLSDNRRRQIKKVREERLVHDADVTEQEIKEWYMILQRLYRTKVRTPLWPVEFFLEVHWQGVGKFLLVKHNNHVIGGSMIVTDGKCVYEWFECGMNAEYRELYPSVMATWAGMQWAHEHDCTRYDMMGAGEPDVPYGVRDFKSEFGGELVEHGRYLCVLKPMLYKLGTIGVMILKKHK